MKSNFKYTVYILILVLLGACSNDTDTILSESNSLIATPDIVLQERDPNAPETITRDIIKPIKTRSSDFGVIGNTDILLGHGYKVGNSIMGDYPNVGDIIIDIEKVKAINSEYVMGKQLFGNETRNFAYTTFDRYEYNSTVTKKKSSGFSINIAKIFSFGRKKKTTEVFSTVINNSTSVVYGELNIDVRNSLFSLQGSDGARKIYARQCLSNTFVENLFSSTISNIQNEYGHFVLAGYYTGGRAFAMYGGRSIDNLTTESKESDMTKDISASFTYKSSTGDGNLNIGKGSNSSSTNIYKNTAIEIYIKTLGGIRRDQAATTAVALDGLSINLTPWLNSLSDINTHTIIDVAEGGLYPLSAFVLEENFKRRFDDTSNELLEVKSKLSTPYIEILPVYVRTSNSTGEPLYEVAAVLNTRQGDKIVLSDGSSITASDAELQANNNEDNFNAKARKVADEKKKYFIGSRIISNFSRKLNPSVRAPYVCIRLSNFNEKNMYRFKNTTSGIEYIYDPSSRIAFSYLIAEGDNDWILDDYKIRDWVEGIPEKKISMGSISNLYKVIGL